MPRVPKFLSSAGRAGPLRIALFAGGALTVIGAGAYFATGSKPVIEGSRTAPLPSLSKLPGGIASDQEQERLARLAGEEAAHRAAEKGDSYTPTMAPGVERQPRFAGNPEAPPTQPHPVVRDPSPNTSSAQAGAPYPAPAFKAQPTDYRPRQAVDPKAVEAYEKNIQAVLRGFSGQRSETAIDYLPDTDKPSAVPEAGRPDHAPKDPGSSPATQRSSMAALAAPLVPAGRMVYAHTILATNSDTGRQIVLQADSGPIAGDRMIGSVSRAGGNADLLVVRVSSVEHKGHSLSADGLVVAPDTMETAVASWTDQHYVSRYILPAAAAFVAGLGSALATTSNTVGQLGPLGNTSYVTSLNFPEQVGVAAGVAGQRVAQSINQSAPTNSTVHLDAQANVAVMFLADLREGH